MAVQPASFASGDAIRLWMNDQPREVAVAFAARAALRILPLLPGQFESSRVPRKEDVQALILLGFRAASAAWAVASFPSDKSKLASAAYAASVAAQSVSRFRVLACEAAAHAAMAASDKMSTARSRSEAAHAMTGANAAAQALSYSVLDALANAHAADARRVEIGSGEPSAIGLSIVQQPLWAGSVPAEIWTRWSKLKSSLIALGQNWDVWTSWYEYRLAGRVPDSILEIARATISEEMWGRGARAVNSHIGLLMDEAVVRNALEKQEGSTAPPIEAIPLQTEKAIFFSSASRGPLELVPDPAQAISDPEQVELYARMRRQLEAILDQIPTQELGKTHDLIADFLDQPSDWLELRQKKILWLCGNSLRNVLSQHDAVSLDPDPHYAKLPPSLAEALRRPIETWNIVVVGDPVLRLLDGQRLGPQEKEAAQSELNAARPVVDAALLDRGVTTPQASEAVSATLSAAASGAENIHTAQATELARGTSQNLLVEILRGAYRLVVDLQDPQSEEARGFVKEYKSGIYKKLGEWTITGVVVGTTAAAAGVAVGVYKFYIPFFEFVAAQGPLLKVYLALAFQNTQLLQIVDRIVSLRASLAASSAEESEKKEQR